MRFISYNVNGLRAFSNHGGLDLIMCMKPDLICFQETKCDDDIFNSFVYKYEKEYNIYHAMSHFKGGYAGVGILSKIDPIKSEVIELGNEYESGRIVELEYPNYYYIGVYTLNSGGKDELRISWDVMFKDYIKSKSKPVIIMGDLNVVPEKYDYWGDYESVIDSGPGLMQFEIDGYNKLISDCNLIDTFRYKHPLTNRYSWFSYRGNAYNNNHGWRLDQALISKELINNVVDSDILDKFRYSDHCPIVLDYDEESCNRS